MSTTETATLPSQGQPPQDTLNRMGSLLAKTRASTLASQEPKPAEPPPAAPPATEAPVPAAPVQTESKLKQEEPAPVVQETPVEPAKEVEKPVPPVDKANAFLKALNEEEVPAPVAEPKAEPYKMPKELEDELTDLRSTRNNPLFKAVEEIVKNGGDVREFAKKFAKPDFTTLSNEDIYKMELQRQGLEGDELQNALEEFSSEPAHKQKLLTNPIRSQLKKESDEEIQNLLSLPNPQQVKQAQEVQHKAAVEAVSTLDRLIQKAAEKGYYGYEPSKEDLELVRAGVMNNTIVTNDGYDVAATFHREMRTNEKIFKRMITNATEMGRALGYEDYIKERVRVDLGSNVPSGAPAGQRNIRDVIAARKIVTPLQNGK